MKLSSIINKTLSLFALSTIAAIGFCGQVKASVFSGDSSGVWGIPNPGMNDIPRFTGVGKNTFTWGWPILDNPKFGTPANSLTFKGTQFTSDFNSLFKIGDLTYFNGTVPEGTSVEQVPLYLQIAFNNSTQEEEFDFDFKLINVGNNTNKPLNSIDNADFVFISPSFANRSFVQNSKNYTLELTGFSQDGGKTSVKEFRVVEGATITAEIYGRITYVPPAEIPEPGIVIGLSSLGVYMLAFHKRG
jgi:hypothetical protein